jgi:predicted transcriptional regulator
MNENENVHIAIQSAIESMSKEELIIKEDELDRIIRQSFLYQTRDVENRSEITKDIQSIIQNAVDNLNK